MHARVSLPVDHWRRMQSSMSAREMERSSPTLSSAPAMPAMEYVRGVLRRQHPMGGFKGFGVLGVHTPTHQHACFPNMARFPGACKHSKQ